MITLYDRDKKTILATLVEIGMMKHKFNIITPHKSVNDVKLSGTISDSYNPKTKKYPIIGFQTITKKNEDHRFGMISENKYYYITESPNIDTSKEQ